MGWDVKRGVGGGGSGCGCGRKAVRAAREYPTLSDKAGKDGPPGLVEGRAGSDLGSWRVGEGAQWLYIAWLRRRVRTTGPRADKEFWLEGSKVGRLSWRILAGSLWILSREGCRCAC